MPAKAVARNLFIGVAAGLAATWITDKAERVLWRATPATERAREPDRKDKSSAKAAARKLLETTDCDTSEENLQTTKNAIHYGLGATWGITYCLLRRDDRMKPLGAGITSGAALSLAVDECLNPVLRITPPNSAFPASTHVRGFVTHIVWGLAAATVAETLQRVAPGSRRERR